MAIKRINHGKHHSYVDTETGLKLPGVTRVTGDGLPKQALVNWAAEATAGYAIDHWDELSGMAPSQRLKALMKGRYAERDAAADRGRQVHKLGEKLVAGERVAMPDGLAGYVDSYVKFLDDFDVEPVHVEFTCYSPRFRYCGTGDLIADLLDPNDVDEPDPDKRHRLRWLLDLKTNKSGIFGETALQLAGYRFAELLVDEDGVESPMPQVDRCGAVHITPHGYQLMPIEVSEREHRLFLYAQQIARFAAEGRELIGEPVESPYASVWKLVRDDN